MADPSASPQPPPSHADLEGVARRLNGVLERYSDKDWAYSRLSLAVQPLSRLPAPYVLWLEWIGVADPEGQKAYKNAEDEVTWGERHSAELGLLEIVSLRLNRALMSVGAPDDFEGARPVIRLMKKSRLEQAGLTEAFWYQVEEVQGEEFDGR